jgi:hypothetical protein
MREAIADVERDTEGGGDYGHAKSKRRTGK